MMSFAIEQMIQVLMFEQGSTAIEGCQGEQELALRPLAQPRAVRLRFDKPGQIA